MSSHLYKDGRFRPVATRESLDRESGFGGQGRLTQINKHNLRVDLCYQREQSRERARRIASAFNWAGFGVLVVSERANGDYFVLDGGHRLLASMLRPEVQNVPCYMFSGLSKSEEAAAFVCYNANRRPPTGLDLFAAQVIAGDEQARAVDRIMRNKGSVVGSDSTACRCPRKLLHLYSSLGEEKFNALVSLVVEVWPKQPDSERMTDQVLSGLAGFLKELEGAGLPFGCPDVARALTKIPLDVLRNRAYELLRLGAHNRGDAFKMALVETWNKGRRIKRLPPLWTMMVS